MISRDQALFLDDHGDDVYGLWEVCWYLEDKHPFMSKLDQQIFLYELIERELLDLFIADWSIPSRRKVGKAEARSIVEDELSWLPPQEGRESGLCYVKESSSGERLRKAMFQVL
jgi:hypothetical protein